MVPRYGRTARLIFAPLLMLLFLGASAAAPFSPEKAYHDARAVADRGDAAAALAKVDAALARAGALAGAGDDEWVWALRILRIELGSRTGVSRDETLRLLEPELPQKYRTSEAAVRRAVARAFAGGSRDSLDEAHRIATKHQPHLLYVTNFALGYFEKDVAEAETYLRKAAQLAKKSGNQLRVANASSALARRYAEEQRWADAVEAGEDAVRALTALDTPGRLATASGNLGWAYVELGNYERAAELFASAKAAAARAGLFAEVVIWTNQIGNTLFAERRFPEAERHYREALQVARAKAPDEVGPSLTNIARTALEVGQLDVARREISGALQGSKDDQLLRAQIVQARILAVGGDHDRAVKTLRDVLAQTKDPVTRWTAETHLALTYVRMRRDEPAEASFRRAVDNVQAARDAISSAELRLSFFNTASDMFGNYVDFLVRKQRILDALDLTEVLRAQTLEESLGKRSASPGKLDARAVARQSGATILCYSLGRDRSHVWTITATDLRHAELPPDSTITAAVDAYRRELLGPRGTLARSGANGQRLYRMLVEPAVRAGAGTRVIVIPDGRLHALNFETLVVATAKPHYWIEDVVLTTAASLQLLARADPKAGGSASMLLVGDPPVVDPQFPKLVHAQEEIGRVSRHFAKRVVLTGAKATPAAYRTASPGTFDFLHFAAHGVATRARPLDSAVILGRDKGGYKLLARDIVAQPLHARLVTISSCHGAGERTFAGEGLVGLAWAFLRAGAGQVIAALWEIDDRATPALMDRMYAAIRAGKDPAAALRDAKLALLRGKDIYQTPKYWAPFVLYSGS